MVVLASWFSKILEKIKILDEMPVFRVLYIRTDLAKLTDWRSVSVFHCFSVSKRFICFSLFQAVSPCFSLFHSIAGRPEKVECKRFTMLI
jgi:hypothetical protein